MSDPPNLPSASHNELKDKILSTRNADRLNNLIAQATHHYSKKDYDTAVELYADATELQAEIHGEMSPSNADLLYAYGRCLYHVAVKNSDVLGSKVAGEKPKAELRRDASSKGIAKADQTDQRSEQRAEQRSEQKSGQKVEETISEAGADEEHQIKARGMAEDTSKNPYFQFTGDENFDSSDDEDENCDDQQEAGGDVAADQEDDFANAYEVLDMARVLLGKQIEDMETSLWKGKARGESAEIRRMEERLADTYDLQAEISLEGENFSNAAVDLRSALGIKERLFPLESSIIAEAHYKLSLALEFQSVTQQKPEGAAAEKPQTATVDYEMREEAAVQMEAAIASCKTRIEREDARLLERSFSNDLAQATAQIIDEVREMVSEMEQRLEELRHPPVPTGDSRAATMMNDLNPLSGILASLSGKPSEVQMTRLEDASKSANDLSYLVKKRKLVEVDSKADSNAHLSQTETKRKAHYLEVEKEDGISMKKTKVDTDHG